METFVRCIWDKVRSVFSEWEGAVRMRRYGSWDVPLSAVWVVSKSRQNGLQEERVRSLVGSPSVKRAGLGLYGAGW